MTLKRAIIRSLDVSLGRPLLAWLTTRRARRLLGQEVTVCYKGAWVHSLRDGYQVPDGERYDYFDAAILSWPGEIDKLLASAKDTWFSSGYTPKPGDTIVDIGAGRGQDVLAFSQAVDPGGKVLVVEANPLSFRLLKIFCELNDLSNVIPVHAAVMDERGSVFIDDDDNWQANTVSKSGRGVPVDATTIDHLCAVHKIRHVDFVKMNIEGAEISALHGMNAILSDTASLCICCHDFRADRGHGEQYRTRECVEELLRRAGFTVVRNISARYDFLRDHVHARRLIST